ncbi:hypothetical protein RIEGSTA812A_PEG_180 [invertebrate metagenome]|uniref:Uncharacterized protein n=1 Tax=invertebrate metagenome TaxID=1711999 RepID=A0A484H4Q0_9ZZZZ
MPIIAHLLSATSGKMLLSPLQAARLAQGIRSTAALYEEGGGHPIFHVNRRPVRCLKRS